MWKLAEPHEELFNYGLYNYTVEKFEGPMSHKIPNYAFGREGPGENGAAVRLKFDPKVVQEQLKKNFMNVLASDAVSLDRSIPDTRSTECKSLSYSSQLPTVAVILVFTNEFFSSLVRTVHSVVNRSPPSLLKEIILVDDFSDRKELGSKLTEHLRRFGHLVKLIRSHKRLGLIRAKVLGARQATADVIVFLDSHCETNKGWLEPLLHRIQEKRSAVVLPVIESINARDMSYSGGQFEFIGTFWWSLHYSMGPIPDREVKRRKNPKTDYINTPTMAGGLFAVNREYFFEVGAYDEEMDIWGGENLEISFRVWMCGGSIEVIPCSRVGHIYRDGHPYDMTGRKNNTDVHGTNSKRLAEVWMDHYKELFYVHRMGLKDMDVGDLSERKEIRRRLNCKPFKWYLDNVFPEKFIPNENVIAYGSIKGQNEQCLDTLQRLENKGTIILGIYNCQSGGSSSQVFSYSSDFQIRRETTCLAVGKKRLGAPGREALIQECDRKKLELFSHNSGQEMIHKKTKLCLDMGGLDAGQDVFFDKCNGSPGQKWSFVKRVL